MQGLSSKKMKSDLIAIISDIHGSISILEKAIKKIQDKKIDTTIVCGDLGTLKVLKFLKNSSNIDFHIVFGNADSQKKKCLT